MPCDQKPGFGLSELTFVGALETEFGASYKPVSGHRPAHLSNGFVPPK